MRCWCVLANSFLPPLAHGIKNTTGTQSTNDALCRVRFELVRSCVREAEGKEFRSPQKTVNNNLNVDDVAKR
jgi:hypothetical protein